MKNFLIFTVLFSLASVAAFSEEISSETKKQVQEYYSTILTSDTSFGSAVGKIGEEKYGHQLPAGHVDDRFLNLWKQNAPDFPPQAFYVSGNNTKFGFDTYAITDDTDGGSFIYIFTSEGEPITSGNQGEGEDLSWD